MSETSMWRAVISQAILDATYIGINRTLRLERDRARAWLTRPSEQFDYVCALAGLEPDRVRAVAIKLIEQHDAKPKPRSRAGTKARQFTFNGRTMSLDEWAFELGVQRETLHSRMKKGWPLERALSTPIKGSRPTQPGGGSKLPDDQQDRRGLRSARSDLISVSDSEDSTCLT